MATAQITINGRRASLDGVPPHTTLLDFVRDRGADRLQGGLRRGRVRRLLGARRPPRHRERDRVGGDQRLPAAGRRARRPGGRHRRGARPPGRAASRPVRDGGARRLAVRLLHARLRLQHGRRVLPARPRAPDPTGDAGDARARAQRLRPARAERQPVPLHRLPADPRRGLRPGRAGRGRRAREPLRRAAARARRHRPQRRGPDVRAPARRWPTPCACCATGRTPCVVAGCTDWGVEVNLRGRRADLRRRHRPADRTARTARRRRRTSSSAPR